MEELFLTVFNMSLTGAFVIIGILIARLPLKKSPKIFSYCLWAVVGFRLVIPFSIEGLFSLLPFKSTPIPTDIATQPIPRIDSGIKFINNSISSILPSTTPSISTNPLQSFITTASYIWILGIAFMLIYSTVSIILLKYRLRRSVNLNTNIYETDNLKTPFVIGLFRPKIYIPTGLVGEERNYIILHEQTHIKRLDHVVKVCAYYILCLHWFNPFAWVAFLLMGADMEMSCDEHVMNKLGYDIKKAYSMSLVRVAAGKRILNGCPVAFGEGGMKERIKNVLNLKKPSRIIIITSVLLVLVLSVGFMLSRANESDTSDIILHEKESANSTIVNTDKDSLKIGTYYLKSSDDTEKLVHLSFVTLNSNNSAALGQAPISSYMLPPCTYSVKGDEIRIHAVIKTEWDEEFYNLKNEDIIARFTINDQETLIFTSGNVPLFADSGAKYVYQPTPPSHKATEWLNYYQNEEMPWGKSFEMSLPEYPNVTFKWTYEKVTATDSNGEITLFGGMPIWNVYLADLNNDGLPELCATVSFGSGIIDTRVVVYDYNAGKLYELSDRMHYDYSLSLDNGQLIVTQTKYPNGEKIAEGSVELINDKLMLVIHNNQTPQP